MRKFFWLILIVFAVPAMLGVALLVTARHFDTPNQPGTSTPENLVLDSVNVLPIASDGVLPNRKISIKGGKIVAIDSAGPPYLGDSQIIDLEESFVMPGLVDMHVHVDDREQLRLALSYGVTTVRNMDGFPAHLRWKDELANNDWLGARLFTASPSLHGEQFASPIDIVVHDTEHAKHLAQQLLQEGWDFVKVYSGLGLDEFNALTLELSTTNLPIVGHPPYAVVRHDYSRVSKMHTMEHVEEIFQGPLDYQFNEDKLREVVQLLVEANATICPTLATFENLTRLSREKEVFLNTLPTSHMTPFGKFFRRRTEIDRWLGVNEELAQHLFRELDFLKLILARLNAAGVNIVLGTDAGTSYLQVGPSLYQEMRLMLDADMSTQAVLRSATLIPARALGVQQFYGSVEVGKVADLVVTVANPLNQPATLQEPSAVILGGRYLDKSALLELREGEHRVAGWWISLARYFETVWSRLTHY